MRRRSIRIRIRIRIHDCECLPMLAPHASQLGVRFDARNELAKNGRHADRKKCPKREARQTVVGDPVQLFLLCQLSVDFRMQIGNQALYATDSQRLILAHSADEAMLKIELMSAAIAPHLPKTNSLAPIVRDVKEATC